ncbi:MAG: FadR family transcriptional regulator [Deltaproteobacteria bacterium]|nr:FadR family transcriptional regulator [Deltaproteobacteria bacterium]
MNPLFKKAKQNRAFEDIVSQIQEAILEGRLKTGDRLSGERLLRETFEVSRGTLREALRTLEQKKLIEIRTGMRGGAIVCPVNTLPVSESLDLLLRYQKIDLKELSEFREEVEGAVAERAARRAKKEDIRELTSLLESIKHLIQEDRESWREVIRKDNQFHFCLARIAGNRVFESVLSIVYENIFRYFDRFLPKEKRVTERIYEDLCGIVEAIKKKDSQKTKILIQDHVKRFDRMMEANRKKVFS